MAKEVIIKAQGSKVEEHHSVLFFGPVKLVGFLNNFKVERIKIIHSAFAKPNKINAEVQQL